MSSSALTVSFDEFKDVDAAVAVVEAAGAELERLAVTARIKLASAVSALGNAVHALACTAGPAQRATLASRLYWDYPRVSVSQIVGAFGFANQADLLRVVDEVETGVPCQACGDELRAASRSRLKEIQAAVAGRPRPFAQPLHCRACMTAQRATRAAQEAAEWHRTSDDDVLALSPRPPW